MKYASHGVLLTIGFLLIGFFVSGSNLAFGLEEDLGASQLASSMKKLLESKEDMMNVWCAFFMECPEEISESIPSPSRDPQYVSLTDGEIFEKMILDSVIAADEIEKISSQYEDSDYYELDDPKTMEDLQKIMDFSVDVILDLSPIVTELEFRGYVFHPMFLKDQRCLQTPYIEFPEIKLPEVDATKSELLDWSNQNNQKVIRYNELAQWIYGNNFQNISSDDDKNEIKDITNILQNFEESLVKFEENPTSQNFSNLKDALETIHANSEENDDRFLLVLLDVTEDRKEVEIEVSIEIGDYFESNIVEKCLEGRFSGSVNEQIQNIDASESQLSVPITFPSYSDEISSISPEESEYGLVYSDSSELKTSQSTKQKISQGVTPENPLCKNDMQVILKISNNKPLCVKPTTAEKLIQRDNFSNLKTYFITYEVYNGFTGPLVCDSGDFAISGGSEGGTSDIANMRMLHQLPDRVVFSSSDQDDDFHLFIYAYCADISEPFR